MYQVGIGHRMRHSTSAAHVPTHRNNRQDTPISDRTKTKTIGHSHTESGEQKCHSTDEANAKNVCPRTRTSKSKKNPRVGSARETQGYVSDGTKSEGWSIAEVDDADVGDSKRMRKADVNE